MMHNAGSRCRGAAVVYRRRGAMADLRAAAATRASMHVLEAQGDQRIPGSRAHEQHPTQNSATAGTGGFSGAGARCISLVLTGARPVGLVPIGHIPIGLPDPTLAPAGSLGRSVRRGSEKCSLGVKHGFPRFSQGIALSTRGQDELSKPQT